MPGIADTVCLAARPSHSLCLQRVCTTDAKITAVTKSCRMWFKMRKATTPNLDFVLTVSLLKSFQAFRSLFQCALSHIWLMRSSSKMASLNYTFAVLNAPSRLKLFMPTRPSIFLPLSELSFYGSTQLNSTTIISIIAVDP